MDCTAPSPAVPLAPPAPAAAAPEGAAVAAGFPAEGIAVLAAAVVRAARELADAEAARLPPRGFMQTGEAARFCGISAKLLRSLVHRRRVPVIRLGRRIMLFRPSALSAALERLEVPARLR
jgi:hypothetical protein